MKKIRNAVGYKKRVLGLLAAVLAIASLLILPRQEISERYGTISTTARVANIQKYGNVVLDLTCQRLLSSGFEYGDVLRVSFLEHDLKLPLCSNYSDVDPGTVAVFARQGDANVQLAVNMKDFATVYGIGTKITAADNSVSWQPADGTTSRIRVSISMDTKGGYYGQYLLHQLSYSTDRADYPNLSDAQFANFRAVTTTGMGRGKLYRSASPVNPLYHRNTYADAAIRKAGITTIMNLADDPETIAAYPHVQATYYSQQNFIALNMGIDFEADDFKKKLAEGIRYFLSKPGVYLVHCTEGKDRAGYVVAILECLMGAGYDEVAADYMTSFYNYYGIAAGDERYNSILSGNLDKSLRRAFGTDNLRNADLSVRALEYLKSTGLTAEEIADLKHSLSEAEVAAPAPKTVPAQEGTPAAETEPVTEAPADIYPILGGIPGFSTKNAWSYSPFPHLICKLSVAS